MWMRSVGERLWNTVTVLVLHATCTVGILRRRSRLRKQKKQGLPTRYGRQDLDISVVEKF